MRLLVLILALFPVAALACPAAAPPAAARVQLDHTRPDQALLTAAILSQVNQLRCQAGRGTLSSRAGLTRVAATHSAFLARSQSLSHASDVPGQEDLRSRLAASGERFTSGAENVGFLPGCGRTYRELANAIVRMWNDSQGHRTNMLTGGFDRAGAGIAFAGGCARAYVTLDLAG